VLQQRVDLRKYLYGKELGSKLTYLAEYQDLVAMQQDLVVQRGKMREVDAAAATLKETRNRIAAESRRALFDELAKADEKIASLSQDIVKGRAQDQAAAPRGADRRRGAAARRAHDRRRGDGVGARRHRS
jgi:hypothetical protein